MKLSGRALAGLVLPIMVLLGAAAFLAVQFSEQQGENRRLLLDTYAVMDTARTLLAAVQDAETGQRGFMITGRQIYLEPYRDAMGTIPGSLVRLRELVEDRPGQVRRVADLEKRIVEKLDELRTVVQLVDEGRRQAAADLIQSDEGRIVMGDIRSLTREIIVEENAMLSLRVDRANAAQHGTFYSALGATIVGLLLLLAGTVVLLASNRRLRETENGLAAQTAVLQTTIDSVPEGVAAFDGMGALTVFNRRFFDLLGLPRRLAREGEPFAGLLAADRERAEPVLQPLLGPAAEAAAEDGIDRTVRITFGGREIEIRRSAVPDEGGFLLTCIDVTRRTQAEAIIRRAQKMEAIGHLTGGIAHDFNNLLQVIGSNLDMLAADLRGNERATGRLQNAIVGAERGARLTAQLLAFARRQPLQPKVINLGRMVRDMAGLLRRTLGEHVEVEAVVAEGLWNTVVDPSQVENAILNLAINARDAMPDGGKLTIEIANVTLDDGDALEHDEVRAGQFVMLAVGDTGGGMSPDIIARAFEPFFTTKPEGKGTGLGLSQIYGFVKQSDGHIKISSEVGHGTTVKLYLPASCRPEEAIATSGAGIGPAVVGGSETVLVVEDDAGVRRSAIEMASDLGYRVLEAEDAETALEMLARHNVHLMFTDVVMPGAIKVREFVERARTVNPRLAVLYTSGYTENAILHNGRLDHDVSLLSKPYRRDELALRIRAALDRVEAEPPMPASAPDRSAPESSGTAGSGGKRWTILVVEDDDLVRMGTVEMLMQFGHAVTEASTGYAAIDLLERMPEIEVMITDVGLPGMNGQELAATARRMRPALVIFLATGYSAKSLKLDPIVADSAVILSKPFLGADLQRQLEALARG